MPRKEVIVFPAGCSSSKTKPDKKQEQPLPELTRAAVLSFLKDTRGMISWTAGDLAEALGVTLAQADDALPILEMQGYVKRSGKEEWLTTIAGESLSGSVAPRFRKEAIDEALEQLRGRIRALNADRKATATVTKAVAYGDFLSGRARVQAAEVGVELRARGRGESRPDNQMLTTLRAKSPMVHVHAYESWMGKRSHRKLV
jgi:DNA-binding transcriptional ArsR family regulator